MRVLLDFDRPLNPRQRLDAQVVLATVAGVDRVTFTQGDRRIEISGEGLPSGMCSAALRETGLIPDRVSNSLSQEEASELGANLGARERVRPLGR
jgi:hypothetical protein